MMNRPVFGGPPIFDMIPMGFGPPPIGNPRSIPDDHAIEILPEPVSQESSSHTAIKTDELNKKHQLEETKSDSMFMFLSLILITGVGVGFYLFSKERNLPAKEGNETHEIKMNNFRSSERKHI